MKKEPLNPFDFRATAKQVTGLQELLNSNGWEQFKEILGEEKEIAETAMFENESLDEKQRDSLRLRRNLIVYIMELPELVIEKSKPKKEQKEPDMEVYD